MCPLALSEARGHVARLMAATSTVNGALTATDRDPNPRFYPLRSDDVRFTLAGD